MTTQDEQYFRFVIEKANAFDDTGRVESWMPEERIAVFALSEQAALEQGAAALGCDVNDLKATQI